MPPRPVGVAWSFPVRGDFMTTAHYQILPVEPYLPRDLVRAVRQAGAALGTAIAGSASAGAPALISFTIAGRDAAEAPDLDAGTSVQLYLMLDTPARDGVAFARRLYVNLGAVQHLTSNDAGQRYAKVNRRFDVGPPSSEGRLRLERQGPTLIVSIADGEQADFREHLRSDIGEMAIRLIRFAGVTGSQYSSLDVRLLRFELQRGGSGAPPIVAAADSGPTEAPAPGRRYLWVLLGAAALGLALGAGLLRRRRSAPARPAETETAAQAENLVAWTCAACGKKLRVKQTWIGKRVKCPACGQATQSLSEKGSDPLQQP
jgi:hypothetical protein